MLKRMGQEMDTYRKCTEGEKGRLDLHGPTSTRKSWVAGALGYTPGSQTWLRWPSRATSPATGGSSATSRRSAAAQTSLVCPVGRREWYKFFKGWEDSITEG